MKTKIIQLMSVVKSNCKFELYSVVPPQGDTIYKLIIDDSDGYSNVRTYDNYNDARQAFDCYVEGH